jgi:hypothetical protein
MITFFGRCRVAYARYNDTQIPFFFSSLSQELNYGEGCREKEIAQV